MWTIRAGLAALFIATLCFTNQAGALPLPAVTGGEGYETLTGPGNQVGCNVSGTYPACYYGSFQATFNVGAAPGVSVTQSDAAGGGLSSLTGVFWFEWIPGVNTPAPLQLIMTAGDTLSDPSGLGGADAVLSILANGSTQAYLDEDCLVNCIDGSPASTHPITSTTFAIDANVPYEIEMTVTAEPAELGFSASASIDPEFFLPSGTPGQIIYSSGVTQAQAAVPEPGSLALLATVCGGLLWRRRRRPPA